MANKDTYITYLHPRVLDLKYYYFYQTVKLCTVTYSDGRITIKSNHDVNQMTTVPDSIVCARNVVNVHLA